MLQETEGLRDVMYICLEICRFPLEFSPETFLISLRVKHFWGCVGRYLRYHCLMKIIDTHSHLYDKAFSDDLDAVVERAKQCGVEKVFLPNENLTTLPAVLRLAASDACFFYPMIGLHPTELRTGYQEVLDEMEVKLGDGGSFIGIGEVGLDYYWDKTFYKEQQEAFRRQAEWAVRYDLPLMIHFRAAQRELLDLLAPFKSKGLRGVFHCFGGTEQDARELLDYEGFKLGIGGILTFKKSALVAVLPKIPIERVVLETDSPYLAPVPFRGRRNESAFICYTLERMAEIYGVTVEEVAWRTYENALETFPRAGERTKEDKANSFF